MRRYPIPSESLIDAINAVAYGDRGAYKYNADVRTLMAHVAELHREASIGGEWRIIGQMLLRELVDIKIFKNLSMSSAPKTIVSSVVSLVESLKSDNRRLRSENELLRGTLRDIGGV